MLNFKNLLYTGIIAIIAIVLNSCSNVFLTDEALQGIKYSETERNSFVYFSRSYNIIDENNLEIKTHTLLKAGKDKLATPRYLTVHDGSMFKLSQFDARIIKANGKTMTFNDRDLFTQSLSSARMISEASMKILPITEYINTDDLVEMVYTYESDLLPLGLDFWLKETGESAQNISCDFIIPKSKRMQYKVVNDKITPKIVTGEKSDTYKFEWIKFNSNDENKSIFENKNDSPGLLAACSSPDGDSLRGWEKFGDWYLDLIKNKVLLTDLIKNQAIAITKNCSSDKEKMDTILNFCQKNIRYEQVYLQKGEIIPNVPELILSRGYGDCKDYSVLIYALSKSIGINSNLALCYRGRGNEFYQDIPVDQFNHMIVYLACDGKDYWYDGTNRTGIPGITSSDLINQYALVLENNNSRIIKIKEYTGNLFSVQGLLKADKNDLNGNMKLDYTNQFAIDFFFLNSYLSHDDMADFIFMQIRKTLNESILINKIDWKLNDSAFTVNLNCVIPNTVTTLGSNSYVSILKMFPSLISFDTTKLNRKSIFYFPGYNAVTMDINIYTGEASGNPNKLDYNYRLPAGPFSEKDKEYFIEHYKTIFSDISKKEKLTRN